MKSPMSNALKKWLLVTAGAALFGFVVGWMSKSNSEPADEAKVESADRGDPPVRIRTRTESRVGQLLERLKEEKPAELVKEVKSEQFEGLIEGVIAGMWGELTGREITKLKTLIKEWANQDTEAALAWARSLENEKQRTLAMVSIAEVLKDQDTAGAFDVFCELENFDGGYTLRSGGIEKVVQSHLQSFTDQSPEKLVEELWRIPKNRGSSPIYLEYPESYDFALLIRMISERRKKEATESGPSSHNSPVFYLRDPIRDWAKRDLSEALNHAMTADYYTPDLVWGGFLEAGEARKLGKTADEMRRFVAENLNQLGPEEFDRAIDYSQLMGRNDLGPTLEMSKHLTPENKERLEAIMKRMGR